MKPGIQRDWKGNLTGARFGFNGMNYLVDPADLDIENGICADLVNCDVDYKMNASRRHGFTRVYTGAVTSSWANASKAYCVIGGELYSFDGTNVTKLTDTPVFTSTVEFKQVNDVVWASDGTTMVIIEDTTCTTITGEDFVDVEEIETWLAAHKPANPADWNGTDSNSNFDVDAFKLKTMAGTCLEFYNGVGYLAVENFVYCTKTFDIEHMDIRYNIVAGFGDTVTGIGRVNDGLYVGTTSGVYFLKGTGLVTEDEKGRLVHNYEQTQVSKFGMIPGSMVRVESSLVPDLKADDTCLIFTTHLGIFAAGNGGNIKNLSGQQITVTTGPKAAAFFREIGGVYQYLVCFNVASSLFTPALDRTACTDTVLVNTITLSHMKYQHFAFNSFFTYGGKVYGANARGIYHLEGEKDFLGEDIQHDIDAYALTPTTDFETQEKKMVKDAFLHGRFLGDMEVSIVTEEGEISDPFTCYYDDNDGIHRKRVKIPEGIRATDWQYKISNVDGCDFTLFDFEVSVKGLQRTI